MSSPIHVVGGLDEAIIDLEAGERSTRSDATIFGSQIC